MCDFPVSKIPKSALLRRKDKNIQNMGFPVALYGCETWPVTLMGWGGGG